MLSLSLISGTVLCFDSSTKVFRHVWTMSFGKLKMRCNRRMPDMIPCLFPISSFVSLYGYGHRLTCFFACYFWKASMQSLYNSLSHQILNCVRRTCCNIDMFSFFFCLLLSLFHHSIHEKWNT